MYKKSTQWTRKFVKSKGFMALYSTRMKIRDLIIAQKAQRTTVREHFERIRKPGSSFGFRISRKIHARKQHHQENILFFKRLLKNPKSLGAIMPSSRKLGDFISQHVECLEEEYILEIGAGTGRFTQSLLDSGVQSHQLIVVELDKELASFLKKKFPQICVIEGSATDLETLLPTHVLGKIRTIVSGIPMVNLSKIIQKTIMDACFSIALPHACFLQFTYRPIVPIPAKEFNLQSHHLGTIFLNFPPAAVWEFSMIRNLSKSPMSKSPIDSFV